VHIFAQINPAYQIASLLFLISGAYLYLAIVTLVSNTKSVLRQKYVSAGFCLILYSFFCGLMTITANETLRRVSWAGGFIFGCLFFQDGSCFHPI